MSDVLDVIVRSRESAHEAAKAVYLRAQILIADGKPARILAEEAEDDRSIQQNRFYWGVVLKELSEQGRIEGVRYVDEAWHGLGKRLHLGYEIVREKVAGRKGLTVYRRLKSTRKLKVKAMSVYLEKVMAWAVTDFGVRFSETRWEDYRQ